MLLIGAAGQELSLVGASAAVRELSRGRSECITEEEAVRFVALMQPFEVRRLAEGSFEFKF